MLPPLGSLKLVPMRGDKHVPCSTLDAPAPHLAAPAPVGSLQAFSVGETHGRAAAGLIRSLAQLRNGLDQHQAPAAHNVSLFHQRVFCFIL